MEPNYVGENGYLNAFAVEQLFGEDVLFFADDAIEWDEQTRHHALKGMQVNAGMVDGLPVLSQNLSVITAGAADLLCRLEADERLRIARSDVSPSLDAALRKGDVTGITLFNLIACNRALRVMEKDGECFVLCDERLVAGIPGFCKAVATMAADMRAYNDRTGAFSVFFIKANNPDADCYLGAEATSEPESGQDDAFYERIDFDEQGNMTVS